jgi:hypothetical protein
LRSKGKVNEEGIAGEKLVVLNDGSPGLNVEIRIPDGSDPGVRLLPLFISIMYERDTRRNTYQKLLWCLSLFMVLQQTDVYQVDSFLGELVEWQPRRWLLYNLMDELKDTHSRQLSIGVESELALAFACTFGCFLAGDERVSVCWRSLLSIGVAFQIREVVIIIGRVAEREGAEGKLD